MLKEMQENLNEYVQTMHLASKTSYDLIAVGKFGSSRVFIAKSLKNMFWPIAVKEFEGSLACLTAFIRNCEEFGDGFCSAVGRKGPASIVKMIEEGKD